LARLYQQVASPQELQRTFSASFGAIGQELAACQSRIMSQTFDRSFWKAARRSIITNAFRDRPWRHAMLGYFTGDLSRLWERMRHPRGISILYTSSARPGPDLKAFFQQMKLLYPIEKSDICSFPRPSVHGKPFRRLGFRLHARRLFVLFKGGLFMRIYQFSRDSEIPRALQTHTRYLFPSRTFIWAEDSQFHTWLAHVETGFMAEKDSLTSTPVSSDWIAEFIAAILQHYPPRGEPHPGRPGACIALAGPDASGRSAVARSLSSLALAEKQFHRFSYFQWPPHLRRKTLFPLRALGHLPDARQLGDEPLPSRWRIPRACKNWLLAVLGYWLRLRPLLRMNSLVLLDGYDCHQLSDPGAVANRGLAGPLAWLSSLYPRPDLLVVLNSPAEALRSRDPALSTEEALRQTTLAEQHQFDPQRTLQMDASNPPLDIARVILQRISLKHPPDGPVSRR
jgi:hypothetical protein